MENKKVVLHFLSVGSTGGIEKMAYNYAKYSTNRNIFVFLFARGVYFDMISKDNTTYFVPCKKLGFVRTVTALKNIIKKNDVDIIVSHHANGYLRFLASIVKKFTNDKAYLVYAHSDAKDQLDSPISFKARLLNILNKRAVKKADSVIAISNFVNDSMVRVFKVNPRKIVTIYNGVLTNDFDKIDYFPMSKNIVDVYYVGRLVKEKGVDKIIKAIDEMDTRYRLTIIGDGPEMDKLKELVRDKSRIKFLGTRNDIGRLVYSKDIFIHVPRCNEGFGNSLVEAMAAGKICVITNKGALPEIIDNNIDGYIIDGSKKSLVKKLNEIQQNRELCVNARKKSRRFSMDVYVKKLDGYLRSIG